MTREEYTNRVIELAEQLQALTEEFGSKSGYLTVTINGKNIGFNNAYWEKPLEGSLLDDVDGVEKEVSYSRIYDEYTHKTRCITMNSEGGFTVNEI